MQIAWASSRVLGSDLCSTSQINLANGLVDKGYNVTFYSPGEIKGSKFEHICIQQSRIQGLQARSIWKNLISKTEELNQADVVLLDWTLWKLAKRISKPTILVDRSPPANSGILAKMQWLYWKKAWYKAEKGTVVSQTHRDFVIRMIQKDHQKTEIIPAGVNLQLFKNGTKEGPIKLAYHGRVDVHRGVMSLPMILAGLHSQGVEAELYIHGNGNAIGRLQNIKMEGLHVTKAMPQEELAEKLATYDIGLLPMPENKIWNLASPLKRSEYLASGMVVCGIDHAGHQIPNSGEWLQLSTQKDFITNTVSWIRSLDRNSLKSMQLESRSFAEGNLSWSHSVDALEEIILS